MYASAGRLFSLALSGALAAGCASPQPIIDTRVIEKPVAVACKIEMPAECRDAYAVDRVSAEDDMVTINRAFRAEIEERAACEVKLKAAIKACQ
jgi:hypothetical protein